MIDQAPKIGKVAIEWCGRNVVVVLVAATIS
jgi:hypothetical protein